jgi:membrane protein
MSALVWRAKQLVVVARSRSGLLDHAIRAARRYSADRGSQLANVITVPGFLSFFPLAALALSIAGFVAHADHSAQQRITDAISGFFPGLIGSGGGQIDVAQIADQRAATGIVGLVGLLLGGLGWVDAMRSTLRTMWHQPPMRRNVIVTKTRDVVVLVGVGIAVLLSLAITSLGTSAAHLVLDNIGLSGGDAAAIGLRILAIALALVGDVLLFGFLFLRLPEPGSRFRAVATGAVFAAVGFEILKSVGTIYIAHTTHNPLYASFAVVIGLLVWTGLVSRLFLFAAAWTVTGAYTSDTGPSGSSLRAVSPAVLTVHARASHPAGGQIGAVGQIGGRVSRREP